MTAAVESFRTRAVATGLVHDADPGDPAPGRRACSRSTSRWPATARTPRRCAPSRRCASDVVPATFGQVPGAEAYVGGNLAFSEDFNAQLQRVDRCR